MSSAPTTIAGIRAGWRVELGREPVELGRAARPSESSE